VRDELPRSIAVTVEEILPREGRDDMLDIYAMLYVERPAGRASSSGTRRSGCVRSVRPRGGRSRRCWEARCT
jgi:GTP-binding protein Era